MCAIGSNFCHKCWPRSNERPLLSNRVSGCAPSVGCRRGDYQDCHLGLRSGSALSNRVFCNSGCSHACGRGKMPPRTRTSSKRKSSKRSPATLVGWSIIHPPSHAETFQKEMRRVSASTSRTKRENSYVCHLSGDNTEGCCLPHRVGGPANRAPPLRIPMYGMVWAHMDVSGQIVYTCPSTRSSAHA